MKPLKRLEIKPSSLDARAPEGVTVMYSLTVKVNTKGPPRRIATFDNAADAQAASDELNRKGEKHGFLTWWLSPDGHHLHKWQTIMYGKQRHFKVSLPYVSGISDEMAKVLISNAIVSAGQAAYTSDTVRVTIDADDNREELGVAVMLPAELAAKAKAMPPPLLTTLLSQALEAWEPPESSLL